MAESSEDGWGELSSETFRKSEKDGGLEALKVREEQDWESVRRFATLLWSMDFQNKSYSQLAILLVKVVNSCPGMLGDLAEAILKTTASTPGTAESWRDVLPLPIPDEVAETIGQVLEAKEFKLKKKGLSGGAVKSAYRTTGVHCLVYCMVVGLNAMWSGLRRGARVHRGSVKAQQMAAIDRLSEAASYMIDSMDGAEKGGIPRTPQWDWGEKVKDARISYQGEVVAKAEPLELDRVVASLPPEGFGGMVNILDVCEGEVLEALRDPASCILAEEVLPLDWPKPKVRVATGEWEKLARSLYDRGILVPTEEVLTVDGMEVTNGLFGVEKVGKDLPDGRTAQRLIMDLRASNAVLRVIGGDIKTLTGASTFTSVVLEPGKEISISGDDLVSSFYLFKLPKEWVPYLAFEREVSWRALGVDRNGSTRLGSAVLPMGFSSSVGIMQHIHRRLALWDPRAGAGLMKGLEIRKDQEWPSLEGDTPLWCLYLDDSTFLRKVENAREESLRGKPKAEQENMRRAYQFWGIPYNTKKAVEEVDGAERLGAFLDGKTGRIGVTVRRALETMSLGLWVLSQGQVTRKSLQVFAGKEVHSLQFRRPLFATYDELWRIISGPDESPYMTARACVEIVTSLCLVPLRFTDWRAEVDPFVMASDASERGGGFCMAQRLTPLGMEMALKSGLRVTEVV